MGSYKRQAEPYLQAFLLWRPEVTLQMFVMSTLPSVSQGSEIGRAFFYSRQRILVPLALGRGFRHSLLASLCLKLG